MANDPESRIEALERQVAGLTRLVERLVKAAGVPLTPDEARAVHVASEPVSRARQVFRDDVRRNVDRILGGEQGDTLETLIGGVWLSRFAMVLIMTTIVVGAQATMKTDMFGPGTKALVVCSASLCAMAYGMFRRDLFAQTILGAGLAGLYFGVYASFFTEPMRVFDEKALAIPLLLACLALLVGVSHWQRSQTVAGVSLFLVYYTVVASSMASATAENLVYALATLASLACVALVFHALHRWLLFTWAAMIATHLTYVLYFLRPPANLAMPPHVFFWLSSGLLTVSYIAFSLACIIDARKTGEYRRTVAPMSGFNSFVYFGLMWVALRQNYPEYEWMFRLAAAVLLLLFAVLAETSGPRRNYLFQIFIAKTVIMFTLALQAYLSGEKLIVAMAIEGLALGFSYKRSGTVVFKVLGLVLLLVTFVAGLAHVKLPGTTDIAGRAIPANWFCCAGAAVFFIATSWFYEHFVRRVRPEDRVVSGQWFMADTFLDAANGTVALFHSAAAALLLLTVTIMDRGSSTNMPYMLAAEGVALVAVGFLLRTPQVQVGGVLLLVASHVCYHAFLLLGIPDFEQQVTYPVYTALVALCTFAGAYAWERYLARVKEGRIWEHYAVAALPYLAATFMLTTLLSRKLGAMQIPLAQNTLGVLLLLAGAILRLPGVKVSGVFAFGVGAAQLYLGIYVREGRYTERPGFLPYALLTLCTYAIGERLFVVLEGQEREPSPLEDVVRWVLVAGGVTVGVLVLGLHAGDTYLTLYWLGLAVVTVAAGAAFRESRYRWCAIALFVLAIVRAFAFDLRHLPPMFKFLTFASLAAALLVVTWAYSRYRQKTLAKAAARAREEASTNG